jgi:hypothetical protein
VYCWGQDNRGQLGNGLPYGSPSPSQVKLSIGSAVADAIDLGVGGKGGCIRRANGSPWCWGANASGEVGDGTIVDRRFATWSIAFITPSLGGPAPSDIDLSPGVVSGGTSTTGTVVLASPAPLGGASVALSSDSPAAMVPAVVTVAAGETTATFPISTSPAVTGPQRATIIAAANGGTRSSTLIVTKAPLAVATLACCPTYGTGGAWFKPSCTVTLSRTSNQSTTVALSSTSPYAVFSGGAQSASISVPAGALTASFDVITKPVFVYKGATISAAVDTTTARSVAITIAP